MSPKKTGICDSCGSRLEARSDDRPEVVTHRLSVYQEQTAPVIRYYEEQGKLARVNGNQPPDKVAALLAPIFQKARPNSEKVDG